MTDTPARKTHHHGALRDAVIAHALDEAQRGTLESLSMRDVSRHLGVSPAAIYRHFDDRDAILHAVAQAGFALLAEHFDAAMPLGEPARDAAAARARFGALGLAYVRFACAHYGLWRLMFGPYGRMPRGTSEAPTGAASHGGPSTYDWLGAALAELHAQGVIPAPTPQAQHFAWTAIHGFSDLTASPAAGRASGTGVAVDENAVAMQVAAILRGLGAGAGAA